MRYSADIQSKDLRSQLLRMRKLRDRLRAVRDTAVLAFALLGAQMRWHLWERWKKGAAEHGPFKGPSDVV
jgi:hypothetical protein